MILASRARSVALSYKAVTSGLLSHLAPAGLPTMRCGPEGGTP